MRPSGVARPSEAPKNRSLDRHTKKLCPVPNCQKPCWTNRDVNRHLLAKHGRKWTGGWSKAKKLKCLDKTIHQWTCDLCKLEMSSKSKAKHLRIHWRKRDEPPDYDKWEVTQRNQERPELSINNYNCWSRMLGTKLY